MPGVSILKVVTGSGHGAIESGHKLEIPTGFKMFKCSQSEPGARSAGLEGLRSCELLRAELLTDV